VDIKEVHFVFIAQTFRFFTDFFLDREYGGVISAVDAQGRPFHCDDKWLLDQGLALAGPDAQDNATS
jgi:hypothetical protein